MAVAAIPAVIAAASAAASLAMQASSGGGSSSSTQEYVKDPSTVAYEKMMMDLLQGSMSPEQILSAQGPTGDWFKSAMSAASPTASLQAAQKNLAKNVAPSTVNTLTAGGMGRSGAVGQQIAGAGGQMLQPIHSQQFQQMFNLYNQLPQLAMGFLGTARPQPAQTTASNTIMG